MELNLEQQAMVRKRVGFATGGPVGDSGTDKEPRPGEIRVKSYDFNDYGVTSITMEGGKGVSNSDISNLSKRIMEESRFTRGLASYYNHDMNKLNEIIKGVISRILGHGMSNIPPPEGHATGGIVQGFATGGPVDPAEELFNSMRNNPQKLRRMAKGGTIAPSDTVPAMLTPGEFVVKKEAVDRIGTKKLHQINNMQGLAEGGTVIGETMASSPSSGNTTQQGDGSSSIQYLSAQELIKAANDLKTAAQTMSQAMSVNMKSSMNGSNSQPIHISVQMDGREVTRAVINELETAKRSSIG
ncbi:hypothetical protein CCP4SC76_1420001 [Gammaproteobacteria bacterium]